MLRKALNGFGYTYLVLMLYRVIANTCLFSISEGKRLEIYQNIFFSSLNDTLSNSFFLDN